MLIPTLGFPASSEMNLVTSSLIGCQLTTHQLVRRISDSDSEKGGNRRLEQMIMMIRQKMFLIRGLSVECEIPKIMQEDQQVRFRGYLAPSKVVGFSEMRVITKTYRFGQVMKVVHDLNRKCACRIQGKT
jgi:hypothetical protein